MNHASDEQEEAECQATKRTYRKIFIGCSAILAVVSIFLLILFLPDFAGRIDPNKKPDFGVSDPDSIELKIFGESPVTFTLSNTVEMMSLLRAGRHVKAHECSYRGQLTMHYASGTNVSMYIRPGHTNALYEFSLGGIFQFSGSDFMAILASEGINTNLIPLR